ncbi:hypothetical protein [Bradyrhizobium sp. th.b2]|uniref:hypothetical protein n=1 Tax=Bradyrhizobium sp. th-b2 TaxID=172088 RepID=UPI001FD8F914|nr:hypothetical protein [Bradyrhizobium sp. th.b2]
MDTTTTTEPASKRARNSSVILTDRMCEKRVTSRVKIYDRKCPGLYVSITTAGVATFSFKFTDPATGKQRTGWLGRLQSRDLRHRGCPQQGLQPAGHRRCGARRDLPRPQGASGEAGQDRR